MFAPATHVRVLAECVLNDPNHRSLGLLRPGDECIIAGDWYAESCIDGGFVERLGEDAEAHTLKAKIENDSEQAILSAPPEEFKKPSESKGTGNSGGTLPGRVSDLTGPYDGIAKSRGRRATQKL